MHLVKHRFLWDYRALGTGRGAYGVKNSAHMVSGHEPLLDSTIRYD